MRLGPLEITRRRLERKDANLVTRFPPSSRGWWPVVREGFAGAWQRSVRIDRTEVVSYATVWSCISLIAQDISKIEFGLVKEDNGICVPATSAAFSPVLRRPNHYQNRIKFIAYWIISKLTYGNAYALKERDGRGVVTALYLLDPSRVQVLVGPQGDVFYQLSHDKLAGIEEASITVPAREIIHDPMLTLYHPLIGVSPIHACGLAATQGLKIQNESAKFFARGLQLSGLLSAPGEISPTTQKRLEDYWEENYAGEQNAGKVAVVGNGMQFEKMTLSMLDAQLVEQLKMTGITVCGTFHVPTYMVGLEPMPANTNVEAVSQQYYSQALQELIESLELCLKEGCEIPDPFDVEADLDSLLRMDTQTKMKVTTEGIIGGVYKPNEGRRHFNLPPVEGGDAVYLQQQNYSLAALNRRDQAAAAPHTPGTTTTPAPAPTTPAAAAPPAKAVEDMDDAGVETLARALEQALEREMAAA